MPESFVEKASPKEVWLKVAEVAYHCGVTKEELIAAITVICKPTKKALKELKKYGIDIDG